MDNKDNAYINEDRKFKWRVGTGRITGWHYKLYRYNRWTGRIKRVEKFVVKGSVSSHKCAIDRVACNVLNDNKKKKNHSGRGANKGLQGTSDFSNKGRNVKDWVSNKSGNTLNLWQSELYYSNDFSWLGGAGSEFNLVYVEKSSIYNECGNVVNEIGKPNNLENGTDIEELSLIGDDEEDTLKDNKVYDKNNLSKDNKGHLGFSDKIRIALGVLKYVLMTGVTVSLIATTVNNSDSIKYKSTYRDWKEAFPWKDELADYSKYAELAELVGNAKVGLDVSTDSVDGYDSLVSDSVKDYISLLIESEHISEPVDTEDEQTIDSKMNVLFGGTSDDSELIEKNKMKIVSDCYYYPDTYVYRMINDSGNSVIVTMTVDVKAGVIDVQTSI